MNNWGTNWQVKFVAALQGSFTGSHVWEIVVRKNLTLFEVCHYSPFYIMISSSFHKINTKSLNLDLCISNCLALETVSLAPLLHIDYVNIRSGNEIGAAFHRFF